MAFTIATENLIKALQTLPGVGIRSATRMALYLLERDPEAGQQLAQALSTALERVHKCPQCRSLTEQPICEICADTGRDQQTICVVANDADRAGIEMAAAYGGRYFVLHGSLSPIDGVGPEELGLFELADWVSQNAVTELIIALDQQVEAEATVHYLAEQYKNHPVKLSRVRFDQMTSGALDQVDSSVVETALINKSPLAFEQD